MPMAGLTAWQALEAAMPLQVWWPTADAAYSQPLCSISAKADSLAP